MTGNTPDILLRGNRFHNFFRSLLTRESFFPGYDAHTGGFTILMPAILLLSAAVFAILRKKTNGIYAAAALTALLSCFLFEQSWWARYIPQLWLVPVCAALASGTVRSRTAHAAMYALCAAGITAGIIATIGGLHHTLLFNRYREEIFAVCSKRGTMLLSEDNPVARLHAKEHGITVTTVGTDTDIRGMEELPYFVYEAIYPPVMVYLPEKEIQSMSWLPDW